MEILVILLKLSGIFVLEAILIIFFKVFSYKLKSPTIILINKTQIPDYIKTFLCNSSKRIEKLGFTFSHFTFSNGGIFTPDSDNWGIVFVNVLRNTFAMIKIAEFPQRYNSFNVEFITYFSCGNSVITMNGIRHNIIGNIPDSYLNDPYAITVDQQWYSHLNYINNINLNSKPVLFSKEKMIEYENEKYFNYVNCLVENKLITRGSENLYRLKLRAAIFHSMKMIRGIIKQIKLFNKRANLTYNLPEIPEEILFNKYKNHRDYNSEKRSTDRVINFVSIYLVLFLVTLMMFSLQYAVIGIIVILVIECIRYIDKKTSGFLNGKTIFKI